VDPVAAGLPGDGDDGRAIEVRVGDAGDEVRRPGPECRQAHARPAGEPPPDVRHERGALLVTARDEPDA